MIVNVCWNFIPSSNKDTSEWKYGNKRLQSVINETKKKHSEKMLKKLACNFLLFDVDELKM